MVVFFSSQDSVDFHYHLLKEATTKPPTQPDTKDDEKPSPFVRVEKGKIVPVKQQVAEKKDDIRTSIMPALSLWEVFI